MSRHNHLLRPYVSQTRKVKDVAIIQYWSVIDNFLRLTHYHLPGVLHAPSSGTKLCPQAHSHA